MKHASAFVYTFGPPIWRRSDGCQAFGHVSENDLYIHRLELGQKHLFATLSFMLTNQSYIYEVNVWQCVHYFFMKRGVFNIIRLINVTVAFLC